MSGYLQRLVERVHGRAEVLQPLVPSRFDPGPAPETPASLIERHEETVAAPPPRRTARALAARELPEGSPSLRPLEGTAAPEQPRLEPMAPRTVPQRTAVDAGREDAGASSAHAASDDQSGLEERIRRAVDAAMEEREPLETAASAGAPTPEADPRENAVEREVRTVEVHASEAVARPAQPQRMAPPAPPPLPQRREAASSRPPLAAAEPAPTIHVTIGRVEVRALPPTAAPPARTSRPEPSVSLHDYLRGRDRGTR